MCTCRRRVCISTCHCAWCCHTRSRSPPTSSRGAVTAAVVVFVHRAACADHGARAALLGLRRGGAGLVRCFRCSHFCLSALLAVGLARPNLLLPAPPVILYPHSLLHFSPPRPPRPLPLPLSLLPRGLRLRGRGWHLAPGEKTSRARGEGRKVGVGYVFALCGTAVGKERGKRGEDRSVI